ncbi:MAG: hypothetical protein PHT40_04775 [Patescibacteria group bacterium]|nr:hypothetical protein [Patescibacteria group bacterium]
MKCDMCHFDHRGDTWVLLPVAENGGSYKNVLVCPACAHKSTTYCLKHGQPHFIFKGRTACSGCINDQTERIISEITLSVSNKIRNLSNAEKIVLNNTTNVSDLISSKIKRIVFFQLWRTKLFRKKNRN